MILIALAAAAMAQWTGPRTVEYNGPGNFCGGGYAIHLAQGDRALILPQGHGGAQGARVVVAGREINIWNGAPPQPGPVVVRYPGGAVTQQMIDGRIAYTVNNETEFGLRLTSDAFRGFKNDRWFFSKADFREGIDEHVACLAARSY
jgi:hypothetical protein